MRLEDVIHIKQNGTFLVIGAVQDVFFDDNILGENGYLNIEKCKTLLPLELMDIQNYWQYFHMPGLIKTLKK